MVVGGGEVAGRKAALLLRAGARVTIIAPRLCEELNGQLSEQRRERAWETTGARKITHRAEISVLIILSVPFLSSPLPMTPQSTGRYRKPPKDYVFRSMWWITRLCALSSCPRLWTVRLFLSPFPAEDVARIGQAAASATGNHDTNGRMAVLQRTRPDSVNR